MMTRLHTEAATWQTHGGHAKRRKSAVMALQHAKSSRDLNMMAFQCELLIS
jgi:hypothetical protein